jgi:hypothetical protein
LVAPFLQPSEKILCMAEPEINGRGRKRSRRRKPLRILIAESPAERLACIGRLTRRPQPSFEAQQHVNGGCTRPAPRSGLLRRMAVPIENYLVLIIRVVMVSSPLRLDGRDLAAAACDSWGLPIDLTGHRGYAPACKRAANSCVLMPRKREKVSAKLSHQPQTRSF